MYQRLTTFTKDLKQILGFVKGQNFRQVGRSFKFWKMALMVTDRGRRRYVHMSVKRNFQTQRVLQGLLYISSAESCIDFWRKILVVWR